ncbi:MAG: hypothetical protein HYX57_01990 [Chloroflexi bacterium]|nr:hypothetical protein [Chloroflexota bacterium]
MLSVAPSALAATVTDSFTVTASVAVTGIPASISYGALDPGTTSGVQIIDANVSSNSAWSMRITGSDFTGPAALGKGAREVKLSSTNGAAVQVAPFAFVAFDDPKYTDAIADATGSAGSFLVRSELRIVVPVAQAPGSYSGTITYTFSAP